MMNFWQKLPKPFFALAPMDGVTDTVFRQIVASVGKPDVFFTEFVPVDALFSKGKERALRTLKFNEAERPIIAQIWGIDPEKFNKAAALIAKLGFDGIDINMGCPDKSVVKKGAGAALIKNPKLAKEIIEATIKGANGLPVSVKTRLGFDISLLKMPIAALTIHLRTTAELSKVPAHWDELKKIRKNLKSKTLIIGNGDIKTLEEAKNKCKKYKIDGAMIGRGIFENVGFFASRTFSPQEKINLLITHLVLFKKTYKDKKHFALMKKFVKCYVNNFDGATQAREKLMKTKTLDELIKETRNLII
ncbi:tRNA-dihydrouridine synthase [Candidatus Daviesbacteria bacterium]|nr:tRNA-dihydrouridine synthase [Candidatus Daviesbacteria bacterium]